MTPTTVLFVCTGNICRSPLAEVMATSMYDIPLFRFSSAGTHATRDHPAADHMITVAGKRGIDLSFHRATRLDESAQPDLVIGMEQQHLVAARKIFPLLDVADIRLLDHPIAVTDPFGFDLDAYEVAADHIQRALTRLFEDLRDRA